MGILLILLILTFLFILLYSNVKVEITFKRYNKDDILIINIAVFYGIFTYKKQIPFMDLIKINNEIQGIESESQSKINKSLINDKQSIIKISEIRKYLEKFKKIYNKFKKYIIPFKNYVQEKILFKRIYWNSEIGVGNADETAIVTGIIWSIKSTFISFMSNSYNLLDTVIDVTPNYNVNTIKTHINCIFTIKLGHIINAGIKILLIRIKDGVKNE